MLLLCFYLPVFYHGTRRLSIALFAWQICVPCMARPSRLARRLLRARAHANKKEQRRVAATQQHNQTKRLAGLRVSASAQRWVVATATRRAKRLATRRRNNREARTRRFAATGRRCASWLRRRAGARLRCIPPTCRRDPALAQGDPRRRASSLHSVRVYPYLDTRASSWYSIIRSQHQ